MVVPALWFPDTLITWGCLLRHRAQGTEPGDTALDGFAIHFASISHIMTDSKPIDYKQKCLLFVTCEELAVGVQESTLIEKQVFSHVNNAIS